MIIHYSLKYYYNTEYNEKTNTTIVISPICASGISAGYKRAASLFLFVVVVLFRSIRPCGDRCRFCFGLDALMLTTCLAPHETRDATE